MSSNIFCGKPVRIPAWQDDIGENGWVYGSLIGDDVIVGNIIEFNDEYFNTEFWYKVDPETVRKNTGLYANNKEIFQGDIIENSFSGSRGFCYKCVWYQETGQWMFDPFMKGDADAPLLGIEEFLQDWETVGMDDSSTRIIGNEWDNPELLKRQSKG